MIDPDGAGGQSRRSFPASEILDRDEAEMIDPDGRRTKLRPGRRGRRRKAGNKGKITRTPEEAARGRKKGRSERRQIAAGARTRNLSKCCRTEEHRCYQDGGTPLSGWTVKVQK
jgi:hypothetical protein